MQEKISNKIQELIQELALEQVDFVVEHPTDLSHGDYSANVALVAAKKSGTNPKELAEKIKSGLEGKLPEVEKIEVAGPGFINFYLTDEFLANGVKNVLSKGENFGQTDLLKGEKIMVEYTDPNPLKEFHIGHLMSNAIGESVARLIESQTAEVKRANWQGDAGIHIAKAVWGKIQKPELSWAKAYAHGSKEFETHKDEIVEINKKVYEKTDEKINQLYHEGRKESLEHFEEIYKKLGTKFDYYFFESEEGGEGKRVVEENIGNIFEASEGAIVFKGEKYDLHTRVFINSQGFPVYEAKELGLNKKKFEVEPGLSKSIIVTGNEIREYFKVLLKVMSLIYPNIAEKTTHLPHGMLRLPSGKMSSRTGDVITAETLIADVKEKVLVKMKESEMAPDDKDQVAEMVAIGAIKYSILKQSIGKDIIFDFDQSISFEGDSGPYLQYTYVRTQSVLNKATETGLKPEATGENKIYGPEKLLYRFPEIVARAGREYAPNYLVTYLIELASSFNSFYATEKIADPSIDDAPYRLVLTRAVGTVLKNGLQLLGIKTPERM